MCHMFILSGFVAPHLIPTSPFNAMSSLLESSKKAAAFRAVDEYILPTHKAVGIGSGSTVVYVVERIRQRPELHKIVYIPTGFQSKILIIKAGLILGSIEQYSELDTAIDGADEVDANLNAIKGGGACHFHEKLVAEAAKRFVIVADYRKQSQYLGTSWRQGVPIEIVPPAYKAVERALLHLSIIPTTITLRMGKAKAGPVVTDNGNFVIDADFGEIKTDVGLLLREIKLLTGVVEVGLFVNMAEKAYFGLEDGGVKVLDRLV